MALRILSFDSSIAFAPRPTTVMPGRLLDRSHSIVTDSPSYPTFAEENMVAGIVFVVRQLGLVGGRVCCELYV
jgi:hypothetical protein